MIYNDKFKSYRCKLCNKNFYYVKVDKRTKLLVKERGSFPCTGAPIGWYIDYIRENTPFYCGYGSIHDFYSFAFPNKYKGMHCLSCIDKIIVSGDCDLLLGGLGLK